MIAGVNSPSNSGQEDFSAKAKEKFGRWFHETPAIARSIMFVAIAGTILGLFGLEKFLGDNSVVNTVFRVQIWRPFTAGFIGTSIISDVFATFAIYQVCSVMEPKKGSTFVLLTAVGSTVFIQFATVVVLTLVGIALFPTILFLSGGGFWPLAFVLISLECKTSTSESRQLMCLPIEVPTKYYPAILAALFFLLSGLRAVDIFVGLGVGYLLGAFTQLQFSTGLCQYVESMSWMKPITELSGYITLDRIGFLMQPGDKSQEMSQIGSVFNASSNSKPARFKAFSGVGHKLGSATSSDVNQQDLRALRGHPLADKYPMPGAIEVPMANTNRKTSGSDDKAMEEYLV